jgi:transcriptional regulator
LSFTETAGTLARNLKQERELYTTKHFSPEDEARTRKLIHDHGFATVLSFPENDAPFINHFPVIFSTLPGQEKILIGHMAKRNPQWTHFQKNPRGTLIFQGPNTYITPTWYRSGRDVPTWNYAVAHVHGKMELVEDFEGQVETLRQLSDHFEADQMRPWQFELPEDLLDGASLCSAIISFRFQVESVEAKFKLSQNRPQIDRDAIIEGLLDRADENSFLIRELMMENENKK